MLPKRREKGLLTAELPNEMIVYDTTNHKIHCLNPIATLVWQHCDGGTSEAELAAILHRELGRPADELLVPLTLEKLGQARLLEGGRTAFATSTSRRDAVKQLARFGATAAAALVVTITAPTPTMAATLLPIGASCTHGAQCQSGCCCFGAFHKTCQTHNTCLSVRRDSCH
jgi:hypothetical protein